MSDGPIEQTLAAHQVEASGMNVSTPDRCTCGAEVWPERGDEYADVRRRRAFAKHQAQALAERGVDVR